MSMFLGYLKEKIKEKIRDNLTTVLYLIWFIWIPLIAIGIATKNEYLFILGMGWCFTPFVGLIVMIIISWILDVYDDYQRWKKRKLG